MLEKMPQSLLRRAISTPRSVSGIVSWCASNKTPYPKYAVKSAILRAVYDGNVETVDIDRIAKGKPHYIYKWAGGGKRK